MGYANPRGGLERFSNQGTQATGAVHDSTGNYTLHPDSLAQTLTYNGQGQVSTISVVDLEGNTFVQTFTYTSGNLTGISAWVKQ